MRVINLKVRSYGLLSLLFSFDGPRKSALVLFAIANQHVSRCHGNDIDNDGNHWDAFSITETAIDMYKSQPEPLAYYRAIWHVAMHVKAANPGEHRLQRSPQGGEENGPG